jgi:hypothetical protein
MALRVQDRYASATDLAADVEHWLADQPVSAHREPLRDRLRRWVRRHQTLVTGLAALVLTATVALAGSLVLLERERGQTAQARDDERQAKQQVKQALVHSEAAERSAAEQRKLALMTVRAVVRDIHEELKDKPRSQELRKKLLRQAESRLQQVARAADTAQQADHELIWVFFELGDLFLYEEGGVGDARKQYEQALVLAQHGADAHRDGVEPQRDLAIAHAKLGDVRMKSNDPAPLGRCTRRRW